ncbi:proteasome inhibitor PI31 subunit-like [Centruroides sculpturatus]|uniref:proteasome inhibitor PI31 subunit-like n=1 Tax=Centruroides sculpturatus TaxID=218467 RepID=UPI000C6CBE32|nr:proteasome inhibitor PI31 subunit-like [Centruroides sculpturatus]
MSSEEAQLLENIFSTVKDQFTKKADAFIIPLHCSLISTGKKCVGVGEYWPRSFDENGSENLPERWNKDKMKYVLRYLDSEKNRFSLEVIEYRENHLFIKWLRESDQASYATTLDLNFFVTDAFKEFQTAYTSKLNVFKDLVELMLNSVLVPPDIKDDVSDDLEQHREEILASYSDEPSDYDDD